MAIGICVLLNVMLDHATAVTIRKLRTEVTDLGFAASEKKIPSLTLTNN